MRTFKISFLSVAAFLASLAPVPLVSADEVLLEEIIVTARKRPESLQNVPLSISAISEQDIERLGVTRTADVAKLDPGLIYNRGIGGSDIRPDIRGITQLSGRSNLAILVDGVDQTTDALTGTGAGQLVGMGLFDLERIEVVKGPQSALFGRNAFGGAISYVTKRPSEEFEAKAELEAAEYGRYRGKLGISGPISDQLLYRLNFARDEAGGNYKHPETRDSLGESETDAVSFALQWRPNNDISNLARLDYSDQEQGQDAIARVPYNSCEQIRGKGNPLPFDDGTSAEIIDEVCEFDAMVVVTAVFPPPPTVTFGEDVPVYRGELPDELSEQHIELSAEGVMGTGNEVTQFTNLFEWSINENYTLVSNTAFIEHEGRDDYDLDQQGTATELQATSIAGLSFGWVSTDNPLNYRFDAEFDRNVIFEDLRLSFDSGDSIQWMIGGEYYSEEYDQVNYQRANQAIDPRAPSPTATSSVALETWVDVTPGSSIPPQFRSSDATVTGTLPREDYRETRVSSIYGSFDWQPSEQWEVSLSARYQKETVEMNFTPLDSTYLVPAFEDQKAVGTFYPSVPTPPGGCSPTPLPAIPGAPTTVPGSGVQSPSLPPQGPPGTPPTPGLLCSSAAVPVVSSGPREVEDKETFTAFNPRAAVAWHMNDNVMLYGSVARGTKPGGFNFNANLLESNLAYDQEELIVYELGWKTTWEGGRTQFNGTLFFNDNTDKQANNIQYDTGDDASAAGGPPPGVGGPPATPAAPEMPAAPEIFVDNIGEVETYGAELKLTTMIAEGLFFDFNYVYTHTEIKSHDQTISPDGEPPVDLRGEELPWTPEHSAVGTLRYAWDIGADVSMYGRWDTRYMSERNLNLEGNVQFKAKTVSDVRLGMTTGNLEIMAYVDNVFDDRTPEHGVAFVNFFQAFQDLVIAYMPPQRTFGVRMNYTF